MRLKQNELKPVYLFEKQEVESGYVGTETKDVYMRKIMCNIQSAQSKITAEIYGERVFCMLSLMYDGGNQISENMAVSLSDSQKPTYKIVSVMPHSTHKTILIEVLQ